MSAILHAIERWHRMRDLTDAVHERMTQAIKPVLSIYTGGQSGYGIEAIHGHDPITVSYSGSCRGYRWDDEVKIPRSVITADDPMEAAKADIAERKRNLDELARNKKLAELARLQRELGI